MRIGIIHKLLAIVFITMALTLFLAKFAHRSEAHTSAPQVRIHSNLNWQLR